MSLFVVCIMLLIGCTKAYIITDDLSEPLTLNQYCFIGAITDELPEDFEEDDKPTAETIEDFKTYIIEELSQKGIFADFPANGQDAPYEITGSILDYKKGSGFVRFLIGFGAGSARVTVALRLIDTSTDQVVFGGNFTGNVTNWAEEGHMMFKRVAKDFAKQLEKAVEKVELESMPTG